MNKTETAKIMSVLSVTYPNFYAGFSVEKKEQALDIWHVVLEDYPYALVQQAVKAVITSSKFPPTPAEIIEQIKFIQKEPEMTEVEAWGYISKAIKNSTYRAAEEWEKLPEVLKKIVSPDLLRSWSTIKADDVETVIHSNFLRTFREVQARDKKYDLLPNSVKDKLGEIRGKDERMLSAPEQTEE